MKLTLLYMKNNIKYNRKSYMKLFVVFLMDFILIDAAVMHEDCKRTGYVNLTAGYNTPTGNFMTYDDSRLEFVHSYKYTKKAEVIGKTIPLHEYIDSINSRLFFYSPDHTTSYFLSETASDLGYMEVIVPISALKDLSSYISDDILTFPQFIDNHGDMLRFRVLNSRTTAVIRVLQKVCHDLVKYGHSPDPQGVIHHIRGRKPERRKWAVVLVQTLEKK